MYHRAEVLRPRLILSKEYQQLARRSETTAIYLLSVTEHATELAEMKSPGQGDNW